MMSQREERTYISITTAVRRSGLSEEILQECVTREIVTDPLTDEDVIELRRIRRLRDLGVNLPGIEVIFHMRQRMQEMQAELARMRRLVADPMWGEFDDIWEILPPAVEEEE
jgi:hypothetical protein